MQTENHIRTARFEDVYALADLMCELGYPTTTAKMAERFRIIEADPSYKTFVAESQGQIIGMVGVCRLFGYEVTGSYVRIIALVVKSSFRNHGIGTELIKKAEKWAVDRGASALVLNSGLQREDAHNFYELNGYKIKGYGFYKTL
jgi:GNAT superfamily N-acetyltransferase